MIDEVDNIVRPDKQNVWPELKKKWFVTDFTNSRDLRYPGKMKMEWETSSGAMIA